MKYTADEVIQFVEEENVKFIRLAFCDIYGRQKNISIMPGELRLFLFFRSSRKHALWNNLFQIRYNRTQCHKCRPADNNPF